MTTPPEPTTKNYANSAPVFPTDHDLAYEMVKAIAVSAYTDRNGWEGERIVDDAAFNKAAANHVAGMKSIMDDDDFTIFTLMLTLGAWIKENS